MIAYDLSETRCGIIIAEAQTDDAGEYACKLTDMEDQPHELTFAVEIAVPTGISFGDAFDYQDPLPVPMNELTSVECHARGGYPEPIIRVGKKSPCEIYAICYISKIKDS